MEGKFAGRYTIANPYNEPVFVLFKCPHPRAEKNSPDNVNASALSLVSSVTGIEENTATAWFWSGEIEAQKSAQITVSYRAAAITGVRYLITSSRGIPIKAHRVEIQVEDLPSMIFESGEGTAEPRGNLVVWERNNFLPPVTGTTFLCSNGLTMRNNPCLSRMVDIAAEGYGQSV
jgi:hypothetical protein